MNLEWPEPKQRIPLPHYELVKNLFTTSASILASGEDLMPVVFAGIDGAPTVFGLRYGNHQEKYECYRKLWESLVPLNPEYIVQMNDSYVMKMTPGENPFASTPSQEFAKGNPLASECLTCMVFPRGDAAWGMSATYKRIKEMSCHVPLPGSGKQTEIKTKFLRIDFDPVILIENQTGDALGGDLGPPEWLWRGNLDLHARKNFYSDTGGTKQ